MISFIDMLPPWVAGLVLFVGACIIAELGAALRGKHELKAETFAATAATVSLLSLLIGFTFSVALNRYDARRDMVVEETAALTQLAERIRLEPEAERAPMLALVRTYVDQRLLYFTNGVAVDRQRAADARSDALQAQLWAKVRDLNEAEVRPLITRMVAESLTRVDDAALHREAIGRAHIPRAVVNLLAVFSLLTAGVLGYTTATWRARSRLPNTIFFLLASLAIALVLDLDRPRTALVQVSQQSMLELQSRLKMEGLR